MATQIPPQKSKVSIQHPTYQKMSDQWQKCRDTASGQKAIHDAGITYLPKLTDQDKTEYGAYKGRAQFFNATWRTIQALSGMLFRKPPEVEIPESVKPFLEDVTTSGKNFITFAQQTAIEILETGRMGVLVDYPQGSTEEMTQAEAESLNLRPSMQMYKTENIINWKTERIGNEIKLTLLVLTEKAALKSDNEFEHKTETHYRVLDLTTFMPEKGEPILAYRVRVYRINDKKEDEQIGVDLFPLMDGKPLDTIPFFFFGVDDTDCSIDEPPLIDLMDVNLAHYKLDADHKHGLHFTGLPTAFLFGYRPENPSDNLCIGSSKVYCIPDPAGKAEYLEFTGQGLNAIKEEKDALKEEMAILGARLLTSEKKDAETAQTAQIHRAGESSILASVAETLSIGLTEALKVFCAWAGSPDAEVSVKINKEFLPAEIDPQELTAWVAAQQQGAISHQVLFWNLQKKEAVPPNLTFEEMQTQIEAEGPKMPVVF